MKVLLYFKSTKKLGSEGARVYKNIQSAIRSAGLDCTNDIYDYYDVAHFISVDNEKEIKFVKDKGIPVVISAFYAEGNKHTSFLEHKIKKGHRITTLRDKAFRILNSVDLVIVPTDYNASFLKDNGVTTKIKVCLSGLDIDSFTQTSESEKELFHRYFQENTKQPFVLAFGQYVKGIDGFNAMVNAAKKLPNISFYYVGTQGEIDTLNDKDQKLIKSAPSNLHCVDPMPEDIHKSAIKNAKLIVVPGYRPTGVICIEESLASKKQIIARKSSVFQGLLEDGKSAYLVEFSETITSVIMDYLDGSQQPTTEEGFKIVSDMTIENYGKVLLSLYKGIINKKNK